VDVTADLDLPCAPEHLAPFIDDLSRYPEWLTIVTRADVRPPDRRGPAWSIDLRGRLGPLARSKRLRMVRTRYADGLVVFERIELDERRHSPWILSAEVTPTPAGSRLAMRLHYGGSLWGPVLERMLKDEIEAAKPRLLDLVS
jgi:hypothetical protein